MTRRLLLIWLSAATSLATGFGCGDGEREVRTVRPKAAAESASEHSTGPLARPSRSIETH